MDMVGTALTPSKTEAPSVRELIERFSDRHIGPDEGALTEMLQTVGYSSLDALTEACVPAPIQMKRPLATGEARSEHEALLEIAERAAENEIRRSYIGLGYHPCVTPPVILRNILENPGWYTQYTAYQAEISQGRLEALLNFQTMVSDLTGMEIANASLLDEATAAAEGMLLAHASRRDKKKNRFFVAQSCHPQTIAVVETRARALGIEIELGDPAQHVPTEELFGVLVQYPDTYGTVHDLRSFIDQAHAAKALVIMAADLLALTLLTPPGELGADVAVGSSQRFGVPLGYGGPHAAYFATRDDHKRRMPGRLVGVSRDRNGKPALRLALQTREQHIRREKATSNICTAQVLLAVMAGAYGVYHGASGLTQIATRIHRLTHTLAGILTKSGLSMRPGPFFDTLFVELGSSQQIAMREACQARGIDLNFEAAGIGITLDETCSLEDVGELALLFTGKRPTPEQLEELGQEAAGFDFGTLARTSSFLEHPVFNSYRSETQMMRYLERLRSRDLSLTTSMIPLGSCTMKLNAAAEMLPITLPGFSKLHPFAPLSTTQGYQKMFSELETWLADICGLHSVSLQPNAGSQGEYAGLLTIKAWHESRGDGHRDVCLIPQSAHGTNPASAVMAGMKVVVVGCDDDGNIDFDDLRAKSKKHADQLSALMVTYPSTHGVFEQSIAEIAEIVHEKGGQVYLDGANLNAMVGLCTPGDIGADVCHINLHKTFCIPHGGGGPGMGPIAVAEHLAPFLPGHPLVETGGTQAIGAVAAGPWSSASILPISWMYIRMMGSSGLRKATQVAILNANYIAKRLSDYFPILYRGNAGLVAHECILDVRPLKQIGVEVDDIAKRLMDFGFHAPTMSWPVIGTLMIEPTESESKDEIDRFCDAMIQIADEARAIENGSVDSEDNPLKNAPHTLQMVTADEWTHPYSRERAAFPATWLREHKFWPATARIDNAFGDKNLICSCPSPEDYA